MKLKKHLLAFLLVIPALTFGQGKLSQDFKVEVGNPYPVIDASVKDYFSNNKGQTIAVKTGGGKAVVLRYDVNNMSEASRQTYDDFPSGYAMQKVLQAGDKLFYIYSAINKKEKAEDVFSREINMNDGTMGAPKLLFTTASIVAVSSYIQPAVINSFTGFGIPIKYEVYGSFDNSKLLVRYRLKPVEKNDAKNYDILGFYVFNASLEKLWGGEVRMPYTEKQMNNIAYGVASNGNAFMLAYINESKTFELITVNSSLAAETNKIAINSGISFQELQMRESVDGNITCTGFYANGIEYIVSWTGGGTITFNTNGIANFKIDQKGKVLENYSFEFPIDLINQYESARAKEKNEKREAAGKAGINDLRFINLTVDAQGNSYVTGEQQYVRQEFVVNGQKNVYYYGDVIMAKFDKSGKIIWMKKLPKTQTGLEGKGGLSVKYIKGSNASYVLYLDNIKNADIQLSEVPQKHQDGRGGFLTAYKVDDATGNVEKHSICDIKDINGVEAFQFRTSRIFEAMEKTFLLEIYIKGKEDTMIKMQLTK